MKIVADENIADIKTYFAHAGELVLKNGRAITKQDLQDADILLVRAVTKVNANLLAGTRVRFVGTVTAGVDHLDTAWLAANHIEWASAKGFNAPAVADYVVTIIAALQRQSLLSVHDVKAAVIGCGSAGSLVVKHLRALNMQVIQCDPLRALHEPDFAHTALAEIAEVDLIALHVPLTDENKYPTRDLINKNFLLRQKPACVLMNASRGEVINTADLLQYGTHLTVCLDVWPHEPHVDTALLQAVQIATPHIAGYSVQSKLRGISIIYEAARKAGVVQALPATQASVAMPTQTLNFAHDNPHWQDVVLGIFNPMVMTMLMRTSLLHAKTPDKAFDQLRKDFNYRYEFAYVSANLPAISTLDKAILTRLGVKIES